MTWSVCACSPDPSLAKLLTLIKTHYQIGKQEDLERVEKLVRKTVFIVKIFKSMSAYGGMAPT
jgi:hypothetical protein